MLTGSSLLLSDPDDRAIAAEGIDLELAWIRTPLDVETGKLLVLAWGEAELEGAAEKVEPENDDRGEVGVEMTVCGGSVGDNLFEASFGSWEV